MDYTTVKNNLDSLGTKVAGLAKNRDGWITKYNGKASELSNMTTDRDKWKIKAGFYAAETLCYNPIISVPQFTFNGVTCKNVNFVFMGFAQDPLNAGKAIYMSADCLPEVKVSMDALLSGGTDVGTGTIGKAAETSLDEQIFAITNKHLETYTREYDSAIHNEKVFLPLECEVHGLTKHSTDISTLSKYPQWESFKKSPDSKIKYIDYSSNKYQSWFWWNANKSSYSGDFCGVNYIGDPSPDYSHNGNYGVALAFCL